MEKAGERIVIKVGTKSITYTDGRINRARIASLTGQMSEVRGSGYEIALVSSAAVSAGKYELGLTQPELTNNEKQLAAIYGQAVVNAEWVAAFRQCEILPGQLLLSDFKYSPQVLLDALKVGIPVINGNDATNSRKRQKDKEVADNDRVTKFIAKTVNPSLVILLTDVDGVKDSYGERIKWISCREDLDRVDRTRFSGVYRGEGGMVSKVRLAYEMANDGPTIVIANASTPDVIKRITKGEHIGTGIFRRRAWTNTG